MNKPPYPAPDFSLKNQSNITISRSDFIGKWLVVYFYPKDDTPGCTVEACSIRDAHQELTKNGVHVVGISKDAVDSHAKFAARHSLEFDLLADPQGSTIEAYGAWGKKMLGRYGILRKTFIIDPSGQVVKVYCRVVPAGHGPQILADIKTLQ